MSRRSNQKDARDMLAILKQLHSQVDFDVRGSRLLVSGKMTVDEANMLNLNLHELGKRFNAFKRVDRSQLRFFRPRRKQTNGELTEYKDGTELLMRKVQFIADRMQSSNSTVVYTGAGISTNANIPDFRGPDGVWTRRDQGLEGPDGVSFEVAQPTYSHRAITHLMRENMVHYLTSQNVDGLHLRAKVPREKLSELHGNCFLEICANRECRHQFLRPFDVCDRRGPHFRGVRDRMSKSGISHITGRKCSQCGEGMLRDSVIHFSEDLPELDLRRAIKYARSQEVGLVLGSSLQVTPAADIPAMSRVGGILFAVNFQATGRDDDILRSGGVIVHADIDSVMKLLVRELGSSFEQDTERKRNRSEQRKTSSNMEDTSRGQRALPMDTRSPRRSGRVQGPPGGLLVRGGK